MNNMAKVVFVAFLGGALPVFLKIALAVIPPQTLILVRFIIAAAVLLPIFLIKKQKLRGWKAFLPVAIFGYGNIFFAALGIQRTSPVMSQILYSTTPILVAIIAHYFLHEKLSIRKIMGIMLGFVGVLVIVVAPQLQAAGLNSGSTAGNLIAFLGVMSYSVYTVVSKPVQEKNSSLTVMTYLAVFAIFVQLFIVPFELKSLDFLQNISTEIIIALLYVSIIGTSIYHFLYLHVIKSAGPVTASLVLYLQPVFSFVSAFFLLGETMSAAFFVGSAFALGGAYITSKSR